MQYIRKIIFSFAIIFGCAVFVLPSLVLAAGTISVNSSNNWSGYVVQNGSNYTAVSGSWVVPTVTQTTSFVGDATWVGIGGVNTSDLIQVGTQALVQNNQTTYEAWYETLPEDSEAIPIVVKPGDSVHVSLSEQGLGSNEWLISFTDNTTGQNYQTTVSYSSSLSSAEWIEEMPTISLGNLIARDFGLDNFGTISFTNGIVTQNGNQYTIAQSSGEAVSMFDANNQILAAPSGLGSDGESFSVTRSTVVSNSSSPYQYTGTGSSNNNSFPGRRRGQTGHVNFYSGSGGNVSGIGFGVRGFIQREQSFVRRQGFQFQMSFRKITDRKF